MKIPCPQCNKDIDMPNPTHGQRSLRCENCGFLIMPDPAKSSISTGKTKPVRRIIVVPSIKGKELRKNQQLNRPDLLKKAQMPVADKDCARDVAPETPVMKVAAADDSIREIEIPEIVLPTEPGPAIPKTAPRQKWLNIAAVIGALLIFGGGLIVRDRVLSVLPDMTTILEMAGFDIHSSELEFASVTTKTIAKNGGNTLIVEGMIRNISGKPVKVPAVRLSMRAADKQELYSWFHEPGKFQIQAGETMIFTTQLSGPPSGAKDIHLKFTERRKQQVLN